MFESNLKLFLLGEDKDAVLPILCVLPEDSWCDLCGLLKLT